MNEHGFKPRAYKTGMQTSAHVQNEYRSPCEGLHRGSILGF